MKLYDYYYNGYRCIGNYCLKDTVNKKVVVFAYYNEILSIIQRKFLHINWLGQILAKLFINMTEYIILEE